MSMEKPVCKNESITCEFCNESYKNCLCTEKGPLCTNCKMLVNEFKSLICAFCNEIYCESCENCLCERCACCSQCETGKSFEYDNGLCNNCDVQ